MSDEQSKCYDLRMAIDSLNMAIKECRESGLMVQITENIYNDIKYGEVSFYTAEIFKPMKLYGETG